LYQNFDVFFIHLVLADDWTPFQPFIRRWRCILWC